MQKATPRTVADVEGFVSLLRAACDDAKINATLERLLSMPDDKRQGLVHAWVTDLLIEEAPRDLVQAVACLADDAVAEKAYEVIFNCKRDGKV
jgi:hypothetical protein